VVALSLCLTTIIATGCSSAPTVILFEQDNIDIKAEVPLDQCVWPELKETQLNGEVILYMDAEGLKLQRSCQVIEQSNYDIAMNNAGSVDDAIAAFNTLIEKAKLHNNYAQNELERIDDERKAKSMEVRWYQGLLGVVLILVAL